jgi:hypothetical protein
MAAKCEVCNLEGTMLMPIRGGRCTPCREAALPPDEAKRRAKNRAYVKKYRDKNTEKVRAKNRKYHTENRQKLNDNPRRQEYRQQYQKDWQAANPDKCQAYSQKHEAKNPQRAESLVKWKMIRLGVPENRIKHMLAAARQRARQYNREFSEDLSEFLLDNIPTHCACCGCELDYKYERRSHFERHRAKSPSFDRIDSAKGYTLENVAVTCSRCNAVKSDSTLEELRHVVAYVERESRKRGLIT